MNRLLTKATVEELRKKRALGRRRRQEIITSFKISRLLYRDVQILAKKMDRTQSWVYREAVQSWVTYHMARQKHEMDDGR
jgi:hypothetical protein